MTCISICDHVICIASKFNPPHLQIALILNSVEVAWKYIAYHKILGMVLKIDSL